MFKSLANFGSNALSVLGAGKFDLRLSEALAWSNSNRRLDSSSSSRGRVYRTPVLLVVYDHYCVQWEFTFDNVY